MAINLKQISVSDSDNIKLDKTNYNFDQLVANGGGPQGNVGPKGETGPQGVTGATGEKGNQGYQGTQGPQGSNDTASWRRIQGSGANLTTDTILPIHNNTMLYPPVVSVGFLETDPEYNTAQPFDGANSPYQWIINRKNHFKSNLRLTNAGISNYFDFIMNYDSVTLQNNLTIESKNGVSSTITWYAQNHIFKSNVTGATLLNISDSSITYNTDTIFNRPVTINRNLIIGNSSAGANKIAVAADDTGKVTFKTALEIGGIVPVGTIISILPSIFTDSAKFINSQIYNAANSPEKDLPIPIKVGGGIGDYTGWYLCNGKTWTNGTTNYVLPDLNSFSYSIADNTTSTVSTSQGVASITNSEIALIGGADASLTATTSSPGIYSISGTVQTTSVLLNANGSGTSLTIKKLPQIIYLGVADLYWKDGGVLPQAINTYTFDDLNNTATGCVTTTKTDTRAEGAVSPAITFTQTITAPSSYYFQTIPTTASFTEVNSGYTVTNVVSGGGTYPTSIIVTVSVSTQGINGTQRSITYNTTSNIATIPAYTITYKFIDENTNNGVPTVQITNTGVQGSNTIPLGNVLISAASLSPGMHWTSVPTFTQPANGGLSFSATIDTDDTSDKTIKITTSVTSQPEDGAFTNNIVEIKYNSLAHKVYDVSTVIYTTPSNYSSIDNITNGMVYEVYDLGTDPNSTGILTTSGSVTASTGSIRYIKYRIKADDYFYKFLSSTLSDFSIQNIQGAGNITEYSAANVVNPSWMTGKVVDYVVRDSNFGSNTPGGTSTILIKIYGEASLYTSVINSSKVNGSFYYTTSGSSNLSIYDGGTMQVRPGVTAIARLRLISQQYISGGPGKVLYGGITGTEMASGNFPYTTTTSETIAIAYPSSFGTVNGTFVQFTGTPTINTGSGSFGSAAMELQYSINGGTTWNSCGA